MEEKEEELEGFRARVFQHELDHLRGKHILSWDVSEGEVEVLPGIQTEFPNFQKVNRLIY
jgi:N-formylmethionyl-tRNA deformylase